MTELKDFVDVYALRARVLPALLVTMPAGLTLAILLPSFDYKNVAAIAAAAGLPIFAANAVRSRGKRLEDQLKTRWGGMPTTRMLRLSEPSNNQVLLSRRRDRMQQLTGETLPTLDEEQSPDTHTDQHYEAATRVLIGRVRETKDRFDLVQKENIDYGFRRNLLALRPVGLTVLVILLGVDTAVILLGGQPVRVLLAGLVALLCGLAWITVVRPTWVLEQGYSYAERLFEALDHPDLDPTSAGKDPATTD